jgi:hypothetical protein
MPFRATTWQRTFQAWAWDGLLPVAVLLANIVPRHVLPNPNAWLIAGTSFVVPLVAALIRASAAQNQLRVACGREQPGVLRRLAVALAIVLLLLFEIAAGVMTWMNNVPNRHWMIAGAVYAAYVLVISAALAPPPPARSEP